jgi:Protein of unknown function (DUF3775)
MPDLDISAEKVAWVILRAREFESKVASFDEGDQETSDEQFGSILENRASDPTMRELVNFIRGLNEDEQANLVAIAWIGRGTYGPEDWDEALATARAEANTPTWRYLLGMPLLADYLEDGLDALGISPTKLEEELE